MRAALFHPAAIAAIRSFPEAVRRELGKLLYDVQMEARLGMPQSRPMPSVAPGVEELRVRDRSGVYRAFYYVRSARGVLVVHAFMKKTQAISRQDIEVGRRRLREMMNEEV
jgi:phage-related protein